MPSPRHPRCTQRRARLKLEALEDRHLLSGTALAALSDVTGAHLVVYSSRNFGGVVATFRTDDPAGWHALIDWGDESQSEGDIDPGSGQQYGVVAGKTYASPGSFTITVVLTHADTDAVIIMGDALVLPGNSTAPSDITSDVLDNAHIVVALSFVGGQVFSAYACRSADASGFVYCAVGLPFQGPVPAPGNGNAGAPLPGSSSPEGGQLVMTPEPPVPPRPPAQPPSQGQPSPAQPPSQGQPPPRPQQGGLVSPPVDPSSVVVWRGTLDSGSSHSQPLAGAQTRPGAIAAGALAVGTRQPFVVSIRVESGEGDGQGRVLLDVRALTAEPTESVISITFPVVDSRLAAVGSGAVIAETQRPGEALLETLLLIPAAVPESPQPRREAETLQAVEEYFARLHVLQEASRPAGSLTCSSVDAPAGADAEPDRDGQFAPRSWLWRAGVTGLVLASLAHVVRDRQRPSPLCLRAASLAGGRG
jgi:hypothetical protein